MTGFAYEQPGNGRTDEWYTLPEVFEALGLDFDPAAPPSALALAESELGQTLIVPQPGEDT